MRSAAAAFPVKSWGYMRRVVRRRIAEGAVCTLFLFMFLAPVLRAADNTAASAPAAVRPAQFAQPSAAQTERREEIRQKKIDNPEAEDGANVYRHSAMVQTLARAFGLPVEATARLFEILNFALLLGLVLWVVVRLLPKTLRSRNERIQAEIEQARIATEDASRRLRDVEARLGRLDDEITAIRVQAEHETGEEEKRLRATLEQEKQLILSAAAQDIQAAAKNAQSQLKHMAADLILEHTRRQISVSADADRTLVAGFLSDLDAETSRRGVNG